MADRIARTPTAYVCPEDDTRPNDKRSGLSDHLSVENIGTDRRSHYRQTRRRAAVRRCFTWGRGRGRVSPTRLIRLSGDVGDALYRRCRSRSRGLRGPADRRCHGLSTLDDEIRAVTTPQEPDEEQSDQTDGSTKACGVSPRRQPRRLGAYRILGGRLSPQPVFFDAISLLGRVATLRRKRVKVELEVLGSPCANNL